MEALLGLRRAYTKRLRRNAENEPFNWAEGIPGRVSATLDVTQPRHSQTLL